jgi:hypothetical protein
MVLAARLVSQIPTVAAVFRTGRPLRASGFFAAAAFFRAVFFGVVRVPIPRFAFTVEVFRATRFAMSSPPALARRLCVPTE